MSSDVNILKSDLQEKMNGLRCVSFVWVENLINEMDVPFLVREVMINLEKTSSSTMCVIDWTVLIWISALSCVQI